MKESDFRESQLKFNEESIKVLQEHQKKIEALEKTVLEMIANILTTMPPLFIRQEENYIKVTEILKRLEERK
jgi:hypothetical protein